MYLVSAIKHFRSMPTDQVRATLLEIATKGTHGFEINSPEQQYRFSTLKGEYSGLAAVCYMYVAGQILMPDKDIGFDLSEEYRAAKAMVAG